MAGAPPDELTASNAAATLSMPTIGASTPANALADHDNWIIGDRPLAGRGRKRAVEQDDAVGALAIDQSPIGLGDGVVDAGVADQHRHVAAARLLLNSLQRRGKEGFAGDVGQQRDDEAAALCRADHGRRSDRVVEPPRRRLDPARQTWNTYGGRQRGVTVASDTPARSATSFMVALRGRGGCAAPPSGNFAYALLHLPPRAVGSLARISVEPQPTTDLLAASSRLSSPAILILANFYEGLSCGVRKARVSRSSFHDEKRKKTVRERK